MTNPLIHELFQKTRFLSYESNKTLKDYSLYSSQWSVLNCVYKHTEMTLTQIWKYLNVEAPTITRTVNRLATLGWLDIKTGKDRREKIVRLSTKALQEFPAIESSMNAFENEMLSALSKEEQELFMGLLKKINKE